MPDSAVGMTYHVRTRYSDAFRPALGRNLSSSEESNEEEVDGEGEEGEQRRRMQMGGGPVSGYASRVTRDREQDADGKEREFGERERQGEGMHGNAEAEADGGGDGDGDGDGDVDVETDEVESLPTPSIEVITHPPLGSPRVRVHEEDGVGDGEGEGDDLEGEVICQSESGISSKHIGRFNLHELQSKQLSDLDSTNRGAAGWVMVQDPASGVVDVDVEMQAGKVPKMEMLESEVERPVLESSDSDQTVRLVEG
jgi:hypothetical protein